MPHYDKDEIKELITTDMAEEFVRDLGGDPQRTDFGFIAGTICHNEPGEGSHKLYYYENTKLFRCYTGCDSTFDIFELACKIHDRRGREGTKWTLFDGMRAVVNHFGINGLISTNGEDEFGAVPDWRIFEKYDKLRISKEDQKRI